jgi:hypothetical protein
MDETWIHVYEPKNNPRNGDSGSPCPKKFKTQESSSKAIKSESWDKDGMLLVDFLEKGATIMASAMLHFSTN